MRPSLRLPAGLPDKDLLSASFSAANLKSPLFLCFRLSRLEHDQFISFFFIFRFLCSSLLLIASRSRNLFYCRVFIILCIKTDNLRTIDSNYRSMELVLIGSVILYLSLYLKKSVISSICCWL